MRTPLSPRACGACVTTASSERLRSHEIAGIRRQHPEALSSQARNASIPVHVDGIGRYPQEVESALYFCCLEALQNVAKYANATRVDVRLSELAGELAFEVRDDGQGFEASSARRGSGLQGMADRLEAVGGRLDVRSSPGRGTTVTGRVPVGDQEREAR